MAPMHVDPGHTVLAVPVPALEDVVRERTAHYDRDYVAADPTFGQAHVTVLGPWVREPTPADLDVVAEIAAGTAPFVYRLERIATFPNGIIHLVAEPAAPFAAMTQAVVERYPDHPPYAGAFPDPVPHVTLDAIGPGVDEGSVRALLGDHIPTAGEAAELQLQWWQAGRCHVMHRWAIGGGPA